MTVGVLSNPQYVRESYERGARVPITSEQIKAARALLRWERKDLAEASGLALITIKGIEQRTGPLTGRISTLYALVEAFEKAGVEFDQDGRGVRLSGGDQK